MQPGLVPPDGVKGAAVGPAAGHDRGVLPVTPLPSWCLVPGDKSGAGGVLRAHAAAWARLTSRTLQSGNTARPGRTGKGNPYLRGALGQSVMAAARTDTRLGEQYRRIARRRGKQKAIVAVSRVICEISCILIADPAARFTDPGADYYSRANPARQTRSRIREIERLNPGMKVTLTPVEPAATAA
jgi:hypothetical protein